jgi:hypothetical protein
MTDHDMTTGEAEAWRAGWRAAQEAATQVAEAQAPPIGWHEGHFARQEVCEEIAAAIRAMQPPEPGRKA